MSLRRLISVLGVTLVASASVVAAQPKKDTKKAPAPAKGLPSATPAAAPTPAAAGSGSATGSGSGDVVQMSEDTPPGDMNGTDENPDAPRAVTTEHVEKTAPMLTRPAGYPIEEALRPITLPQNMSEVSIDPHFQSSTFAMSSALRARYGITRQVQLGITYVAGGIYDDPNTVMKAYGFHAGKAVGLDVTVLLQNWLAVRVGVPVYIDPLAVSLAIGAPMKFTFGDKFAIGGLDDLLNIRIKRFAPSFYQEIYNAQGAANELNHTEQSNGHLRIAAYGIYQQAQKTALIGRFGIDSDLGTSGGGAAGTSSTGNGTLTFIRFGVQYTPRKYVDLGASLGFDDLAHLGSFGPAFFLAGRI